MGLNGASPIRIAYVVSTLRDCGPTTQLYNLVSNLDRAIFEVYVITLSNEPTSTRWNDFSRLEIKLCSLAKRRITLPCVLSRKLGALLKAIDPCITHTQGIRADYLGSLLAGNFEVLTTQRNSPFFDYPLQYGRILGGLLAYFHLRTLTRLSNIVSCSHSVANDLAQHGIISKVIQNGVNLESVQQGLNDAERREKRDLLGLPSHGVIFVFTGPLIHRKQPLLLIRHFLEYFPSTKTFLCIVGDGPLMRKCRKEANDSNQVLFSGFLKDVGPYLAAADIFVSAASAEGLPNSLLEALGWHLPVILSDIPPHREVLEINSSAGCLVRDVGTTNFFSSFNQNLLKEEAQQASGDIVNRILNARVMATQYSAVYRTICESTSHPKASGLKG